MQNKHLLLVLLLPVILGIGCSKNNTHYYADADNENIAIFSNTGNNVLSCYIDGNAWRTTNRIFGLFGSSYEVYMRRQLSAAAQDTLIITWKGFYPLRDSIPGNLMLYLAVPKDFSYKKFTALQGQRLNINSSNGYFATAITGLNPAGTKGTGNIYFNAAQLDSVGTQLYSGKIAGLFDADFTSFKITKGRFDHTLDSHQVGF